MLLSMASKPSTPSSAEGPALVANATSKPSSKTSAAGEPSAASSQFDEAFASALQERFGVNKSPAVLPSPLGNPPPPDPKAVAGVPDGANVQAAVPVEVPTKTVAEAVMAAAVKTPVPFLQPASKDEPSATIGSDGAVKGDKTKDDKTKKSQPVPPQGGADIAAVSYPLAMPIVPALLAIPSAAANDKNSPPKSSDNVLPAQTGLPGNPVPAAQKVTIAPPAAAAPSPKDTEAFSINLTPKALPPKSEDNKPEATGQLVLPTKPAVSAMPLAGASSPIADLSRQVIQPKKTGNSSAINSPSAIPSSLGQSSGVDREGKQREKEEPILPKGSAGDAGGSKQEFAGFGSAPALFPKEIKDAGNASDVRPVAQPVELQDNPPTGGPAKEIAIRLQGRSGETINVKLVDQGGQVQVTVRSSDPAAASALRQDLSSLTSSLDKAGWKPEIAMAASGNSFEPVNQARQTDRNNQDPQGNKQSEWQQETPKRRQSVSDMWDELLTNQTA